MRSAVRRLLSKHGAKKVIFVAGVALSFGILLGGGIVAAAWLDRDPVLFQSWESKTAFGDPVFNRVAFYPGSDKDVWMMQQSHFGVGAEGELWERVAIVVSHDTERTAAYLQLPSGSLDMLDMNDLAALPVVEAEKRAKCYMCHANGPRAIRPDPNNAEVAISPWDRLRLTIWNTRIKTYGRFAATPQDSMDDYRIQSDLANTVLSSSACVSCHPGAGDEGSRLLPNRGSLRRQHFMSIDFMLRQGLMPPPGFALAAEEKERILAFISGK